MTDRKLLIWRSESGNWLVAHPFLDFISQGRTREEARQSFLDSFALTALYKVDEEGKLEMRLAPPDVLEQWEKRSLAQEAKDLQFQNVTQSQEPTPWTADTTIQVGDEVVVDHGPIIREQGTYFVTAIQLCEDGHIQLSGAKPDTSIAGFPAHSVLRVTGKRWTAEERAEIVAYAKKSHDSYHKHRAKLHQTRIAEEDAIQELLTQCCTDEGHCKICGRQSGQDCAPDCGFAKVASLEKYRDDD